MLKLRLKNKAEDRLVFVPVVAHKTTYHNKATGEELSLEQIEVLNTPPSGKAGNESWVPVEIETRQQLIENTHFWKTYPSARLELSNFIPEKIKDWKEGDEFEVVLNKL